MNSSDNINPEQDEVAEATDLVKFILVSDDSDDNDLMDALVDLFRAIAREEIVAYVQEHGQQAEE